MKELIKSENISWFKWYQWRRMNCGMKKSRERPDIWPETMSITELPKSWGKVQTGETRHGHSSSCIHKCTSNSCWVTWQIHPCTPWTRDNMFVSSSSGWILLSQDCLFPFWSYCRLNYNIFAQFHFVCCKDTQHEPELVTPTQYHILLFQAMGMACKKVLGCVSFIVPNVN